MNRTTTLVIAAVVLVLAVYAAIQYSGRTTMQPTENPTPPAAPAAPATPGTPATPGAPSGTTPP